MNDIEAYLNNIDFTFESYEKHAFFDEYLLDLTIEDLLSKYLSEEEQITIQENYLYGPVSALKISDYNAILKLKGHENVDLKDDEVLVVSSYGTILQALPEYMKNEDHITIENKAYAIKNEVPIEENIRINKGSSFFYLIIPDDFTGNLQLEFSSFNVLYEDRYYNKSEEKFSTLFNNLAENKYREIHPGLVIGSTIDQIKERENGSAALFIFLGLFLGLIFIISSAAVMALQQLSDASDSLERYKSLKKSVSRIK